MTYCTNCGKPVLAGALFCRQCGAVQGPAGARGIPRRRRGMPWLLALLLLLAATAGAIFALGRMNALGSHAVAIATVTPVSTALPAGDGRIIFGTHLDPQTLAVSTPSTTFASGGAIAWVAHLSGRPGVHTVTLTISRHAAGGPDAIVFSGPVAVDPAATEILRRAAVSDLEALGARIPGTYTMRYLRGHLALAQGTFTLAF